MTEDDKQRAILCGIIEAVMKLSRNERDLLRWAKDHASLIAEELTESERKQLRETYKQLMNSFQDKDAT